MTIIKILILKLLIISVILILITPQVAYNQNVDKNYFKSPIDFPLQISGNYGEIRTNHFHSGIDIVVPFGTPIYAAADGYISRIRKSAGGYGNALYITHPIGLMTVYGHLQKFNRQLESYSNDIQNKTNTFEFTDYPDSVYFPVKKGDIIGYAGNTGTSFGPHLHFEIREADKDIPINPLLFDFNIIDKEKPVFFNLMAYPLSPESNINGKKNKLKFKVIKGTSTFSVNEVIHYSGKIGFSIQANDFMNNADNKQGIYGIHMFMDNELIYAHRLDKISFYETRYINSFIDFEEKQTTGLKFQKLYTEPGNRLEIYNNLKNSGIITATDENIHQIKIIAYDNFENESALVFKIKGKPIHVIGIDTVNVFKYNEENYFVKDDFRVYIKKNSLYKNEKKTYNVFPKIDRYYSKIHQLNSNLIPLHQEMDIAIRPEGLSEQLFSKSLIAIINENDVLEPLESTFMNDFITARSIKFGKFVVVTDTIPPEITITENKTSKNNSKFDDISFILTDNLTGISEYFAYIDGKAVIFEYDLKNNKMTYTFDNHILYNKLHTLTIITFDKKNNKTVFQTEFFK
jgi:hypothetical protein